MDRREWLGRLSISRHAFGRYDRIANWLKLLGGYSPFPLNIDLVLTLRCNLACRMCNLRQEEYRRLFSGFREPELSTGEWLEIIDDIRRSFHFRPNVNLLGGEPSLYEGYLEIAAYAKQRGFRCTYTTNGTFLARDARAIVSSGVDVVVVSIDGEREIHDYIRRAGSYDRAIEGIQKINKLKTDQGKPSPQIFLACAISGDNVGHLVHVIDLAKDLGVAYVVYFHLQFPDRQIKLHHIDPGAMKREIAQVTAKARSYKISVSFYPALRDDQIAGYYLDSCDALPSGCISPWLRMAIMPDGSIVPCRDFVMGNARTGVENLGQVWNSRQFRSFRRRLARFGASAECGRCCRRQY